MKLNEKITFGQYTNLTLLEVYQGTAKINRSLLKDFLRNCLYDDNVPKVEAEWEFIELIVIREDEITIFPDNTFDEDKEPGSDNLVHLGDISNILANYFNSFFKHNWYGIIETFEKFNNKNRQSVIGGDPEYIEWCLKERLINIDAETKQELEKLEINRFNGIKIVQKGTDKYSYQPIILKEHYKFKIT
jgi:hypothetical protein